ncbi:MAG TPA: hypothetical protein VGE01_12975 [Fimbriimonas sp.]
MIAHQDREVLRRLASRVREVSELPEMEERRRLWYEHNALRSQKPMILCFPEGAWCELITGEDLACEGEWARSHEWQLRSKLYWWDHIRDDHVLEPLYEVAWHVDEGDLGVQIPKTHGEHRGSYIWEPPIQEIERDLPKLHFRQPRVDRTKSLAEKEALEGIFGDLLEVRHEGPYWWTAGLTWRAIELIGLQPLMIAMIDDPEGLHRLMGWLRDEHLAMMRWFEAEGLLTVNNRHHYTGSGGVGYTTELPARDYRGHARLKDRWGFAESQETVGCSPEMFAEFVLPYQIPLLEQFGLNCYGCCEPVHQRWKYIREVPRLRRVSVSPWCDQEFMAEALGRDVIFSRKPNPVLVCTNFDEDLIRRDLRHTVETASGCNLEIILKDTHTVQNEPWRITRWVEIALEEAARTLAVR